MQATGDLTVLRKVCKLLKIPEARLHHLPSKRKRVDGTVERGSYGDNRMASLVEAIADAVATEIYPTAPRKVRRKELRDSVNISIHTLVTACDSPPRCSIARRVARAIAVNGLQPTQLRDLQENHGLNRGLIGGTVRQDAVKDFETLSAGSDLQLPTRTVRRFQETTLANVVEFILSPSNISPLSWGTREVWLSDFESLETLRS